MNELKYKKQWFSDLIATWFLIGNLRPAAGTWGSVAALPFAILLWMFWGSVGLLGACLLLFPLAVWSAHLYGINHGEYDHSSIVIDEVVGQWIVFLFMPPFMGMTTGMIFLYCGAAFALFRLFDITKPFPVSYFDSHVKNGFGVVMDDVVAGIMAGLMIMAARLWIF
jgi:phosphatidylglycerophosphatase A